MDITEIPKVELHCHLDGIVSPEMVRDILIEDPAFPLSPHDFSDKLPVQGYDSFWNWWTVIDPLEGSLKNFQPVLKHYIASLKAQNVHYFELMIAAGELPIDDDEAIDDLHQFREWMNVQEAGQIQVEFLIVLNRTGTPEKLEARTNKVLRLHQENLVCGISFAGPEPNYPVKPYHHLFKRLHEAGVRIEIHAGEWVGSESVWDAVNYGFPDRIGHGISLFEDERLINLFQEQQIHLEFCPTSNLKTGSVDKIENQD
jgi:adenosine deaminase